MAGASVIMPLLESAEVDDAAKRHIADLVCRQRLLIAGNYSEATSTALIGERWLDTVARRDGDGWRVKGRKMFASMIEAADHCLIMARPAEAATPSAGSAFAVPKTWASGPRVAGGHRPCALAARAARVRALAGAALR